METGHVKRKCQRCGGDISRYTGTGQKRRETRKDARFCSPMCAQKARRVELAVSERTRAIMLTFYVIESQSAAAPGRLLADDAGRSGRGMRPHPRL